MRTLRADERGFLTAIAAMLLGAFLIGVGKGLRIGDDLLDVWGDDE